VTCQQYTQLPTLVPNQITTLEYDLLEKAHTFKKGHKIMVHVQSSWFPVIDRNLQKFVNIYEAVESDFQKAKYNPTLTWTPVRLKVKHS